MRIFARSRLKVAHRNAGLRVHALRIEAHRRELAAAPGDEERLAALVQPEAAFGPDADYPVAFHGDHDVDGTLGFPARLEHEVDQIGVHLVSALSACDRLEHVGRRAAGPDIRPCRREERSVRIDQAQDGGEEQVDLVEVVSLHFKELQARVVAVRFSLAFRGHLHFIEMIPGGSGRLSMPPITAANGVT